MSDNNPFLVRKRDVSVRLTLSTGRVVSGTVQCSEHSEWHHGRERVKDVLNGEGEFMHLWGEGRSVLIHKAFIEQVELSESDLASANEPDLTEHRDIDVLLASGAELSGTIFVSAPLGHTRTLDFLNRGERFYYLDSPQGTRIISLAHTVTVRDQKQSVRPPAG